MARTGLFGGSSQEDGALRLEVRHAGPGSGARQVCNACARCRGDGWKDRLRDADWPACMWAPHRGAVACAAESRYACHMQLECTVLDEVQPVGCGDARSEYTVAGTGLQSPGLMGDVVGTDAAAQRTGPGTRAGAGVEVDRHVCFVHRGCLGRVINGPAGAYIGCMVGSAPRAGVEEERPVVCIGSASGTSRTAAQLGFPTRGAEASARFVCDTVRGSCSWVREGGLYGPH